VLRIKNVKTFKMDPGSEIKKDKPSTKSDNDSIKINYFKIQRLGSGKTYTEKKN